MVSPNIMQAPRWAIVAHWATCYSSEKLLGTLLLKSSTCTTICYSNEWPIVTSSFGCTTGFLILVKWYLLLSRWILHMVKLLVMSSCTSTYYHNFILKHFVFMRLHNVINDLFCRMAWWINYTNFSWNILTYMHIPLVSLSWPCHQCFR